MAFDDIDRIYCFSLGDFHNSQKCFFDFLVRHHLQKRYELEEGNKNAAIGSLLDLVIKIIHRTKAYSQPLDYLLTEYFKAAENEMKDKVERAGPKSFYGATISFLTEENINLAKQVFQRYYQQRKGKINQALINDKFWQCLLEGEQMFEHSSMSTTYKIWGGPDALEMGDDGIPEIVDYKYFEDPKKGKENLDMDLMPKLYTLLCAPELINLGYTKARFRVRSWTDPLDENLYEEFDLEVTANLKDFFKHKIEKILSITEVSFCEREYCKSCQAEQRKVWLQELVAQGFVARQPAQPSN